MWARGYAMSKSTKSKTAVPATQQNQERVDAEVLQFREQFDEASPLDEIVRQGARSMLQAAIEAEAREFVDRHSAKVSESGNRLVVRNGWLPTRQVMTGAGQLEIQQPRIRDNDPEKTNRVRFSPTLIPQ